MYVREMTERDMEQLKAEVEVMRLSFELRLEHLKNSPELREAILELYFKKWASTAGFFMTALFTLIENADSNNRERVRLGFPMEVLAWESWYYSENEKEFLKQWDLPS